MKRVIRWNDEHGQMQMIIEANVDPVTEAKALRNFAKTDAGRAILGTRDVEEVIKQAQASR